MFQFRVHKGPVTDACHDFSTWITWPVCNLVNIHMGFGSSNFPCPDRSLPMCMKLATTIVTIHPLERPSTQTPFPWINPLAFTKTRNSVLCFSLPYCSLLLWTFYKWIKSARNDHYLSLPDISLGIITLISPSMVSFFFSYQQSSFPLGLSTVCWFLWIALL